MENKNFDIKQVEPREMFEILKPELLKIIHDNIIYINQPQLDLISYRNWSTMEEDGNIYPTIILQVMAYKGNSKDFGTYCVVKITPFDCYWGEGRIRNDDPNKYGNLRNKGLTKFYRRKMQELYGQDWTNAFKAYVNHVKEYRENLAKQAYEELMQEIESDINEEQTF